ncbi:MAG: hypothetical protein SF339_22560 [Blastocatellia bacterium]|nr:hypothetical protein [Blastocatellia bacterium]
MKKIAFMIALPLCLPGAPVRAQQTQNPSPMVEHTRAHPRLKQAEPAGRREALELGRLFLPARLRPKAKLPLFVHFHGGTWLPEVAADRAGDTATIAIQIGAGSGAYARPFSDPQLFPRLLAEAEKKAGAAFGPITLTAWSAGYGAIREILRVPESYARVDRVLLIDGLHTGYVDGKPGPQESRLETAGLEIFLQFARDAAAGRKRMIVTHSEIFPGTFASTTETADWLLAQLGLPRTPVVKWGPMGTQQLSEARRGRFRLIGYAGNSAPDHVDQLHSLPEYLKWLN